MQYANLDKLYQCIRIQQLDFADCFIAFLLATARKNNVIAAFCEVLAHLKANARAAASDHNHSSSHTASQTS